MKQATYRFFAYKDDQAVDISTLPEEQRKQIGVRAYQTMLHSMGYQADRTMDQAAGQ